MANSTMTFFVYVLTFISFTIIQVAFGANPVTDSCSTTNNFTENSPFNTNLIQLLSNLSLNTPALGFSLQTVEQSNQSVFGMAMCRGDTNVTECTNCINDATANIVQLCPNNKEALIWFETCFLKYSDTKFFGTIDVQHSRMLVNVVKPTEPFFLQIVVIFFRQLSQKASLAPKLFASGVTDLPNNGGKLFALVECTRDLSGADCKKCIDATTAVITKDNVAIGGRILSGSCSLRYETRPFF